MKSMAWPFRYFVASGGCLFAMIGCWLWLRTTCNEANAAGPGPFGGHGWAFLGREDKCGPQALNGSWYRFPPCAGHGPGCDVPPELGGSWMWLHSPEQERVVASSLYTRYCIRCHSVDGRGVWDIPGVPDFTNVRWQSSRSDDQIARIIIEGRGAVMPTFRGVLSIEEAFALARYLRTLVPGTEASRPDLGSSSKTGAKSDIMPPIVLPVPQTAK
jgi:hypothetical protein